MLTRFVWQADDVDADDGSAAGDPGCSVFRSSTEPYLGRASVEKFDRAIVACLDANYVLAERTRQPKLSDLQVAACELIPQGIKLALAIRELVRQGYLFAGRVLMRPLIERAAIIFYLEQHPDQLAIWKQGWKRGARPSLATMLAEVGKRRLQHIEVDARHLPANTTAWPTETLPAPCSI